MVFPGDMYFQVNKQLLTDRPVQQSNNIYWRFVYAAPAMGEYL
jgi:hypothetical protein